MFLIILFILSCTTVNVFAVEFIWSSNDATQTEIFEMNAEAFLKILMQEIQQQNQKFEDKQRKQFLEELSKIQQEMQQNLQIMFKDLKQDMSRFNENQQKDVKDLREEIKNMEKYGKSQYEIINQNILKLKTNQQTSIDVLSNEIHKEHTKIQNQNEEIKKNTDKYFANNYPSSCAEAVHKGQSSGIYTIQVPILNTPPFAVYCEVDPEGGAAWTIFQRRMDGTIDFYRNWTEYKSGFGNLNGEYFLGLDALHLMSNSTNSELWIKLGDFENGTRHAKYTSFGIGNEAEAYALHKLGSYSGNSGDSLTIHKGCKFSTKDVDNDMDKNGACAPYYKGAWWYKICFESHLNGRYLRGNYSSDFYGQGVKWNGWYSHQYSLKYAHMALRPSK